MPDVSPGVAHQEQEDAVSDSDGYMRVAKLRALLAEAADDLLVVLAKDAEGNSFSPLAEGDLALYVPEATWAGDVPHPDDAAGYQDEPGAESAVVLWPVN